MTFISNIVSVLVAVVIIYIFAILFLSFMKKLNEVAPKKKPKVLEPTKPLPKTKPKETKSTMKDMLGDMIHTAEVVD